MFMQKCRAVKKTTKNSVKDKIISCAAGIVAGGINGLFGGGGGMIVVPILIYFLKFSQKSAHATAILIILPLSIVSSIFYFVFGSIDFSVIIPTAVGVTVGGIIGALILSKSKPMFLTIAFSIVMAAAGVKMLFF